MIVENTKKNLNDEIKEIIKKFPRDKLWIDGYLVLELQKALKSKENFTKKNVINKYYKKYAKSNNTGGLQ